MRPTTLLIHAAKRLSQALACMAAVAALSGCAATRPTTPPAAPLTASPAVVEVRVEPESAPAPLPREENQSVGPLIRAEVERYLGTPHRMGGTDERGFDCSGFVLVLYRDLFGITLPRTTTEQVLAGSEIRKDELVPGDLVFFRPGKVRHVGIYVGDGEFAHASSSRGVMYSALSEPYWQRAYWTSRRIRSSNTAVLILPPSTSLHIPSELRTVSGIEQPPTGEADQTLRAGW